MAAERRSGRAAGLDAEPEPGSARLDARLLMPSLAAWGSTVALLGAPTVVPVAVMVASLAGAAVTLRWAGHLGAGLPRHLHARTSARRGSRLILPLVLTLLVTGLCAGAVAGHGAAARAGPVGDLAGQRAIVQISGTVAGDPRTLPALPGDERGARSDGPRALVRLTVTEIVARGQHTTVRTPVLLLGGANVLPLRWGERIHLRGRLAPADPGDDVVALVISRAEITQTSSQPPWLAGVEWVRTRFRQSVGDLPADGQGLLPGLVIGDTSLASQELTTAMTSTGMSHLSAVSGSNVSLVLSAALGIAGWFGVPRRRRPWVGAVCLIVFVAVCRPEPSVIRAAAMGVVGLLSLRASRRRSSLPALAAAITALLCVDPWLATSYGFALSTLATLGLILFARPWAHAIKSVLPRRLSWAGEAIAVPLAAQVACGPVAVLLQGDVALVSVPANVLAAPFVAPATGLGIAVALLALVSVSLASWLAWAAAVPVLAIAQIAWSFADLSGGHLPWPDGEAGALLLLGLTLVAMLYGRWLLRVARHHRVLTLGGLALALSQWGPFGPSNWPPATWSVVACDVGQGDALVISTGPEHAILIDTGPDPEAVDRCLSHLGVQSLDLVVLSHFHSDHVGGLAGALRHRTVGEVLVSPERSPPAEAATVERLLADRGIPRSVPVPGDRWDWEVGVRMVLVHPQRVPTESPANNSSLTLDIEAHGIRLLTTGDLEPDGAAAVRRALRHGVRLDPGEPLDFDVLKVAHHGSRHQDASLIADVRAEVALISVGRDNDYGHPSAGTLELLRASGAVVYRTDEVGSIALWRCETDRLCAQSSG